MKTYIYLLLFFNSITQQGVLYTHTHTHTHTYTHTKTVLFAKAISYALLKVNASESAMPK